MCLACKLFSITLCLRIKKDHFKQKLLFWLQVSFKYIKSTIINNLKDLLTELEGFKSLTTLALEFKKLESEDETKYSTLCLSSKVETIINGSDIDDVFELIYCMIISRMYWKRFKLDYLFSCRSHYQYLKVQAIYIKDFLEKVQVGLFIQL